MTHKPALSVAVFALCLIVAAPALAKEQDVKGSQDHPLLTRYSGSVIIRYDKSKFDRLLVPVGPATSIDKFSAVENAEGLVTRLTYEMDAATSTLAVVQSYRDALSKAGFKILYACAMEECGNHLFFQNLERPFIIRGEHRYLAAKGDLPGSQVYVTVRVYTTARKDPPVRAMVHVVEVGRLKEDLVTVNAEAMASEIEKQGHIALYGIYFDTDKAEVKPDSEGTLKEMAKFLSDQPRVNVYIVGHTDNVGTLSYNIDLSRRRADAVVEVLVKRYGGKKDRLIARGVGPLAPVATNRSADGKAKNRRVEMVEK